MKVTQELPRYRCHKEVKAGRIASIENTTTGAKLHLETDGFIEVDLLWQDKHRPQTGGYYVLYKDGYASFSPAAAFEEGYTRL